METTRTSLVLLLAFAASIHCNRHERLMKNYPPCKENNCQHGEPCVIMLGYNFCLCDAPYYGDDCKYRSDVCDSNPCLNGGTCSPTPLDGYLCDCPPDAVGQNCQLADQCKSQPCQNGGKCLNVWTTFFCGCKGTGYSGKTCETISE